MALFIFRRDLRLNDNIGLINALIDTKENVYPLFILNPEQIDKNKNEYFSNNSVQFMCESLRDLNQQLDGKLSLCYGNNLDVLEELIKPQNNKGKINEVYFNLDYSGYSQKRDKAIIELCAKYDIVCHTYEDIGLFPIGTVKNSSGQLYSKFTPFYEKLKSKRVSIPLEVSASKKSKIELLPKNKYSFSISNLSKFYKENLKILVHGGRSNALEILKNIKTIKGYGKTRDYPSKPTTHLSAYLKYGCISVREAYYAIKKQLGASASGPLLRQLYWREFYLGISKQNPQIMEGKSLKPSYDKIKWLGSVGHFNKWKEGNTGFPIVDAGMREMNHTGYMHNRLRMIVSSFLIKTLLIDWRKGEKYFAQSLVDYDFSNNNGGWQWSSGSGTDSQPYFRIFNPWSQSERYDEDAVYIKKWIPELKDVPAKTIHNWHLEYQDYKNVDYPKPIVDYDEQKKMALKMYQAI